MSSNIAIRVKNVSKHYPIYKNPQDRLRQFFYSGLHRFFGAKPKKYYQEFQALENISFEVKKGQTVGIIGRNGSGKSTLLQIICGILNPTSGEVFTSGRIAALLELGSGFNPEFTGRENIYLNASIFGLNENQINDVYEDIVNFADIGEFIEQPIKTYSSGMVVRLAFAVIAHVNADILIIDEALAVGDAVFTQKCMRFLRKYVQTGTLFFVSHDVASVNNFCESTLWLDNGRLVISGNSEDVTNKYMEFCAQKIYGDELKIESVSPKNPAHSRIPMPLDLETKISFFANIENSNGWRSGVAEILGVDFRGVDDQTKLVFNGGERIKLTLDARALSSFSNPILGFFLKDRLGQSLFGEHTFNYVSQQLTLKPGERIRADFIFDLPLLPNGDYSLTVSVAEGRPDDNKQHHWIHDAVIVRVHSAKLRYGLVGIPFEIVTLKKIDET
jgi:lipopolysaccharide transport system ATP-binding protein